MQKLLPIDSLASLMNEELHRLALGGILGSSGYAAAVRDDYDLEETFPDYIEISSSDRYGYSIRQPQTLYGELRQCRSLCLEQAESLFEKHQ